MLETVLVNTAVVNNELIYKFVQDYHLGNWPSIVLCRVEVILKKYFEKIGKHVDHVIDPIGLTINLRTGEIERWS
jgi:hypothetical protein